MSSPKAPTPRTDAVAVAGEILQYGDPTAGGYFYETPDMVPAEFARELERQHAELLAALKAFVKANDEGPPDGWLLRMLACDKLARASIAKAEGL